MKSPMFDEDIQAALLNLDKSVPKKRRYALPIISALSVFIVTVGVGLWGYQTLIPSVSQDHLMRMIIVSSRTNETDPVRLMLNVEQRVGKRIEEFGHADRVHALEYLMNRIELKRDRTEMIVY